MFKLPPKETFLKEDGAYDHQRHLYIEAIKHCTQFRNAIDIGGHVGFFSSKMADELIPRIKNEKKDDPEYSILPIIARDLNGKIGEKNLAYP